MGMARETRTEGMGMTIEQASVLREIAGAIVEVVNRAGPMGAPGGVVYAGLMAQGCTLNQFQQIMDGMIGANLLRKRGECYFAPDCVKCFDRTPHTIGECKKRIG